MGAYDAYLIAALNDMIAELPDNPTLDATALKAWFDASSVQIKNAFNLFVVKTGADKDAFDAWKADLQALNMDAGAAAALGTAILSHNARHAAGGPDALTPSAIGAASLSNGIVAQSQARSPIIEKTASFTLGAGDNEAILPCNSSSAIVVTMPSDATYNFPAGTTFNFIRWGSGALSFAKESAANWVPLNNVTAVSVTGAAATVVKIASNMWWLICG